MPLPEGYIPHEGDVLIFHGTVRFSSPPKEEVVHVRIDKRFKHSSEMIPMDQIVGIYCRHWEPGDRVVRTDIRYPGEPLPGIVVAMHEDQAWVLFGGSPVTLHANVLAPEPVGRQPETIEPRANPPVAAEG